MILFLLSVPQLLKSLELGEVIFRGKEAGLGEGVGGGGIHVLYSVQRLHVY
jgi:hypothetical protein